MATTASNITNKVGVILQDTTHVRWPLPELYQWITDGQREVVLYKPDACVKNEVVTLAGAQTKQVLSSLEGITKPPVRLLELTRNYGLASSPAAVGKAVRFVDRAVLDAQNPDWHAQMGPSSGAIVHYMHDPRDPLTFYVYPKPWASTRVEAVYSYLPKQIVRSSDLLDVTDIYANAVTDYVLFRCYSKDSEYAGNAERAVAHYQAFANAIGIKGQADAASSPAANEH